jgi:peroxiredoxin
MSIKNFGGKTLGSIVLAGCLPLCAACISLYFPAEAGAQGQQIVWSKQEKPILEDIRNLRNLSEGNRAKTTKQLALKIRQLPAGANKERLAVTLATLSTEGDAGKDTLQEVATTLAEALREQPIPAGPQGPEMPYSELAKLVLYEHVQVNLDDPQYATAVSKVEADDLRHQQADFTLTDLHGKAWALKDLRGQVVLVSIWAAWYPSCLSEMPDLDSIYRHFKKDGLIVLAITDEKADKAKQFVDEHGLSYPVLLDSEMKAHEQYAIDGLPRSFVYDRDGKLVAQAINSRTKKQFLDMLVLAGLH